MMHYVENIPSNPSSPISHFKFIGHPPLFFLFVVVQIFLFPVYVLKSNNSYLADSANTVPQQMFLVSVQEAATR